MPFALALLSLSLLGASQRTVTPVNCIASRTGNAAVQMCLGEQELAAAEATKASADRERHLRAALDSYRKASIAAEDTPTRVRALDAMTRILDREHLNELADLELVVRELIATTPNDVGFMFRLAKVQEDQGQIDTAEDTLLIVRHRQPEELVPYKMLVQFYARRATAISNQALQAKTSTRAADIPGTPDKDGIYRVGGGVQPAQRVDTPLYPDEAKAAGVSGAVQAEVVVNEQGVVTNATIVKSVPLLDEAALNAVKQWHFRPAVANGQAVPIRMVVTVSFSLSQ